MNPPISVLSSAPKPLDRPLCAFCGRSFSQYTCPSCNAGYCSLACYRSEAHSQCTESFYRKSVEDQIRTEPNSSVEDRRQMIEMLKRLEDNSNDEITEDTEDGDLSLSGRLAHLNIDEVDFEGLWAVLDKHEKEAFNAAIQDPLSEPAQELLAVHDLEVQSFSPWWEAMEDPELVTSSLSSNDTPSPSSRAPSKRPQLMAIPLSPSKLHIQGQPSLLYNIFATTLAYAFATRHLVASPLSTVVSDEIECAAAREDIGKTAPFLVERRSTMVFGSVDQVVTEVWSRMDSMSNASLIHLLKDTIILLEVPPVTPADDELFAAATPLLLLLSDLHALFSSWSPPKDPNPAPVTSSKPKPPVTKPKVNHIAMKIAFYAARAATTPAASFVQLRAEIERKIEAMHEEAGGQADGLERTAQGTLTVGRSLVLESLRGIHKARPGPSSARLVVQELE
ncbi:hypothetical protein BS47DRAFT_1320078 [Hydnum rufescens UP504]|uniref:HIT-type domain-containing protein n=1 Tax=Hydnum rufescens UP504 TaxID=1448309 RepID=A0A9P6APR7_9AGAM|nr:hypothetical protein BS47DRAFT_1320078 [Hydnum rufescens UP504]